MDEVLVLIGRVSGAFGVRGEVRIRAYGEDPLTLLGYGALCDRSGRQVLALLSGRAAGVELIGRARDVESREAAEALRGQELYVPRSRLPEPAEDEFYLVDLIGLAAVSPAGDPIGRIRAVQNYGAGDILEVAPETGASFLVAFTRETVPEVSLSEKRLVLVRPAETDVGPEADIPQTGAPQSQKVRGGGRRSRRRRSAGGADVHQTLLGDAGDKQS